MVASIERILLVAMLLRTEASASGAAPSGTGDWAYRYELDTTWAPEFPTGSNMFSAVGISSNNGRVYVTQRGNSTVSPVIVLDRTTGKFLGSWGEDDVAIDRTNPSAATWGAHGLTIEDSADGLQTRVFVEDFTNFTITAFEPDGGVLFRLGTPGLAGNGTSPVQFGKVADAFVQTSKTNTTSSYSFLYASDGDGGSANRCVKIKISGPNEGLPVPPSSVVWATPSEFANPHSIAYHESSGMLLVADREHNATKLLDATSGEMLGSWNCGLDFGREGKPFGIRTLNMRHTAGKATHTVDIILVASMDNPQDGKHQRISVLDATQLTRAAGAKSPCRVLQTIRIDPETYSGPHLLGVDHETGDIYAALVAASPRSAVLRFNLVRAA